jgi:hypothetical protein
MITFITAFYSPTEKQYKTTDFYFEMFEQLASSSVNIMLYLDDRYIDKGKELCEKYNNVRIEYKNFQLVKKEILDFDEKKIILPSTINTKKDTIDYLYIQLSKLYHLSLYSKYYNNKEIKDTHIAWIDFGIFYLFKDKEKAKIILKIISKIKLPKDLVLAPGSTPDIFFDTYKEKLFDIVTWFFCGSFIMGDINLFNNLYEEQMTLVYNNLPKLTWEVNYWAIIQQKIKDKFIIVQNCDHNDIMLENTFNYIINLYQ